MIRAVLDTNVYVAALLSRDGAPARLVQALAEGRFDAVTCPRLLAELAGVLARPKIASHVDAACAGTFVEWLTRVTLVEADTCDIPKVSPDAYDDYLVALARSADARVIVSGDAHLLELVAVGRVRMLSPAAFARFVESLP